MGQDRVKNKIVFIFVLLLSTWRRFSIGRRWYNAQKNIVCEVTDLVCNPVNQNQHPVHYVFDVAVDYRPSTFDH
jgi:hypothetical protein